MCGRWILKKGHLRGKSPIKKVILYVGKVILYVGKVILYLGKVILYVGATFIVTFSISDKLGFSSDVLELLKYPNRLSIDN